MLKGKEASSGLTLRASTPATRDQNPPPDRAVMATKQRGSSGSHLVQALAPPSPALPPT